MASELRNTGASVRARLLQRARIEGTDFQILLMRYALERLLYRLSVSDQRERFILNGAMLFAVWQNYPFRPTRDIDLLGLGDSDPAMVAASIRAITSVAVPDDGVVFDDTGVEAAPIRGKANILASASELAPPSPEPDCPSRSMSVSATRSRLRQSRSNTRPFSRRLRPSYALIRLKPSLPRKPKRSSHSVSRTAA